MKQNDFVFEEVPAESRESWIHILLVWLGFIIIVGIMTVGGGLASQLSFNELIIAVLVGNLILAIFAFYAGYTGSKSGKSFNLLLSDAFKDKSWKLASLYVPIVLIGWYAIEAAIFGHLIASVFGVGIVIERIIILVSGFLFATSAYFGFKALKNLSLILVPILILIGAYAIKVARTSANATYGFADTHIGLGAAISIVVGTWIMGALTALPDMTRFNRNPKTGSLIGGLGLFFGNTFTLLIGAAAAALTGESDPALILISLGFIPPAIAFGVANIWTTNDSNMYSSSLHFSRMFKIKRKTGVLIGALIGSVFAMFQPYQLPILFSFLGFLGNTSPALGSVVLGNYWVNKISKYKPRNSIPAWAGWILGSLIGLSIGGIWTIIVGFLSGLIVYCLLFLVFKKKA